MIFNKMRIYKMKSNETFEIELKKLQTLMGKDQDFEEADKLVSRMLQ